MNTTQAAIEALAQRTLNDLDHPNFRGRLYGRPEELARELVGGDHTNITEFLDLMDQILDELDQEEENGD